MQCYDAVVIGAGHNGLTCAAYFGMTGLKVKVLEKRNTIGGAAVELPRALLNFMKRSLP
jgi:phytoene dehydrogenase-like protein